MQLVVQIYSRISILEFAVSSVFLFYTSAVVIMFFIFHRNNVKFSQLVFRILSHLTDDLESTARKNEKRLKIIAVFYFLFLIHFYFEEIYFMWISLPDNFVDGAEVFIIFCLTTMSGFAADSFSYILQFVFFNVCVQICSLLRHTAKKIEDLDLVIEEGQIKQKLQEIVEFHQEILEIISTLMRIFRPIICISFAMNTVVLGQSLIYLKGSNLFKFSETAPFFAINTFIFCYSFQLVINEVRSRSEGSLTTFFQIAGSENPGFNIFTGLAAFSIKSFQELFVLDADEFSESCGAKSF